MKKILFLCTDNSARSQMAEGLAKAVFGSSYEIASAGSKLNGGVKLYAIEVMREIGVDISKSYPKAIIALPISFRNDLDYVVTLCPEKICPELASKVKIHWKISDPAAVKGEDEERLNAFRQTRDEIMTKLVEFEFEMGFTEPT